MDNEKLPDVRDGLTREERIVLWVLHETQKERGDRNVPTPMLWGRVSQRLWHLAANGHRRFDAARKTARSPSASVYEASGR